MATCPDCGEEIKFMVCGRGRGAPSAETLAALDAIAIAAHKKMGACPKEKADADTSDPSPD